MAEHERPAAVRLPLVPRSRILPAAKRQPQRQVGPAGQDDALVECDCDPDRVALAVRGFPGIRIRDARHARRGRVDPDAGRRAEQPLSVRRGQSQVGASGGSVRVPNVPAVEDQGAAVGMAEAVGGVAVAYRIAELDLGIAVAVFDVRRAPGRVGREPEKGHARHVHGLGKGHGDVDFRAGRVRAALIRRKDGLDGWRRVYCYAPPVPERSPLAGDGQLQVGRHRAAAAPRAGILDDAARHQGARPRVFQADARVVARPHRVVEHEPRRAAAGQVFGGPLAAAKVEQQGRGRISGGHRPVEHHGNVDRLARPVLAVPQRRRGVFHGCGREPDQLDVVAAGAVGRGHHGVRAVRHGEHGGAVGVPECRKVRSGGRACGERRAVAAEPHQLDAVVVGGRHGGERLAAHLKGGDALRVYQPQLAGVGEAAVWARLGRAVVADAHRLDAVVASARGDDGVRAAADLDDIDRQGGCERQRARVGDLVVGARLERAVAVYPHHLDAVAVARGHGGVRAAADLKGGHVGGGGEPQAAAVGNLVDRPERVVARVHLEQLDAAVPERGGDDERAVADPEGVDAEGAEEFERVRIAAVAGDIVDERERLVAGVHLEQLDAVVVERGDDCKRAVADPEGVDADGACQPVGGGAGVFQLVGRLERAVLVHPHQQGGARAVRRYYRVRAAFRLDDRRVARAGEIQQGVGRCRGRGRNHRQCGADHRDVAPAGQRAVRPRGGQRPVGRVARRIPYCRAAGASQGQGVPARIVQVRRPIARLHRVCERQLGSSAARGVRGVPGRIGRKAQRGSPLGVDCLVKGYGDVDDAARGVRPVRARRCDSRDRRRPGVDCDVLRVPERALGARDGQYHDGVRAVGPVADGRAAAQGQPSARVVQIGRAVAWLHRIPERQHVRAGALEVRCVLRRVGCQRQARHTRDVDGDGEPDVDVDVAAGPVRAVCVGRGDVARVRRRRRVDPDASHVAERSLLARLGQGQARVRARRPGRIDYSAARGPGGKGRRPRIVQGGGAVARLHRIRELEQPRAVPRHIVGRAVRPVECEQEGRGRPQCVDGLVECDCNRNAVVRRVRPVLQGRRYGQRLGRPRVDYKRILGGQRARIPGGRQGKVGGGLLYARYGSARRQGHGPRVPDAA